MTNGSPESTTSSYAKIAFPHGLGVVEVKNGKKPNNCETKLFVLARESILGALEFVPDSTVLLIVVASLFVGKRVDFELVEMPRLVEVVVVELAESVPRA